MAGRPVSLPKDGNGIAAQLVPSKLALATTLNASLSSSIDITLNTKTTYIEVSAITKPVLLKWGTGAASAASGGFDEIVQPGLSKAFYVPNDVNGKMETDVNIIEQAASATVIVVEK